MDKNIAVIGGSGFIGSHTVRELVNSGYKPTIIDISSPSEQIDLYWDSTLRMPKPCVSYIKADVTKLDEITKAIKGFDIVYMLAAVSDAGLVEKNPELGLNTNINGLSNVLISCVKNKVERVLFSSSVWVYTSARNESVNENTSIPVNSESHIYTSSKIIGENLVRSFSKMYGLNYTILRYGVAYGPGENESTAISSFIKRSLKGRPITIFGKGNSARSFLYVKDHAKGNVMALSKKAENQTINLDGAQKTTIKEVAEIIKELSDNDIEIIHETAINAEYKGKNVSINKAKDLLGWEPSTSLREGLKEHYERKSFSNSTSRR
jgi:UDP-glucose 4-epimerase